MRARVFVTLKPSVFDPQGQTIADAGLEVISVSRVVDALAAALAPAPDSSDSGDEP